MAAESDPAPSAEFHPPPLCFNDGLLSFQSPDVYRFGNAVPCVPAESTGGAGLQKMFAAWVFIYFSAPKWNGWKWVRGGCIGVNSQRTMCKVLRLRWNMRAQQWYRCVYLPVSLGRGTRLFLCTGPPSCRGAGTPLPLISLPARTFVTRRKSPPPGNGEPPRALHSHLLCQYKK